MTEEIGKENAAPIYVVMVETKIPFQAKVQFNAHFLPSKISHETKVQILEATKIVR